MPVIAKSLLASGVTMKKYCRGKNWKLTSPNSNILRKRELKELYNRLAFENDAEAIGYFFSYTKEDRQEKIKDFRNKWKRENGQSFDSIWEKIKQEIL